MTELSHGHQYINVPSFSHNLATVLKIMGSHRPIMGGRLFIAAGVGTDDAAH